MVDSIHDQNPVFDRSLHTKFWLYLADHPGITKVHAVYRMYDEGCLTEEERNRFLSASSVCLACEYDARMSAKPESRNIGSGCVYCPFKNIHGIACMNGTFFAWQRESMKAARTPFVDAMTKRLVKMFATSIAYWPVRDDVQCI